MKKIIFKFTSSSANTIEEFYTSKVDELSEADFASVFNTMRTAVNSGDVWLRNYSVDNNEACLVWFLDSDAAVSNVQSAIDILVTLDDYIEHTVNNCTFEEFAAYASANEDCNISHPRIQAIKELND
jgi:hypothetical protein